MWYVYILKSVIKKWYYIGSTSRLEERIIEHNTGKTLSTKGYKPFILIFSKQFEIETEARKYERMLKDKRTEKERIIKLFEKN